MTMPKTAAVMMESGVKPEDLNDAQLDAAFQALCEDLPGAPEYIAEVAAMSAANDGAFTYLSRSPQQMESKEEWSTLVGYLARLFASPFNRIIQQWTMRQYGVQVGFVNCCIVMAQHERVDDDKALELQTSQQLTPDC